MSEKKISEDDLKNLFADIAKTEETGEPKPEGSISEPSKLEVAESIEQKVKVHNKTRDQSIKKLRKIIRSADKPKKKKVSYLDTFLVFSATAGLCGFLFFTFLNYQAYFDNLRFWYFDSVLRQSLPEAEQIITYNFPSPTPVPTPTPTPSPSPTPSPTPTPTPIAPVPTPAPIKYDDPKISISKIGIEAPIILDVDEESVLSSLESGVAHIGGTAKPGDNGNIFIVGHSSNYPWAKGDYNHIFSLLDELVNGDIISVYYQNKTRNYKVIEKVIVKPDQVDIAGPSDKEMLSLMTCFPVGTTLKRLVVKSELTN